VGKREQLRNLQQCPCYVSTYTSALVPCYVGSDLFRESVVPYGQVVTLAIIFTVWKMLLICI